MDEAYPLAEVCVRHWDPTRTRAPIECPSSSIPATYPLGSRCARFQVSSPRTVTTASSRPSLSKSAIAKPRCAAAGPISCDPTKVPSRFRNTCSARDTVRYATARHCRSHGSSPSRDPSNRRYSSPQTPRPSHFFWLPKPPSERVRHVSEIRPSSCSAQQKVLAG